MTGLDASAVVSWSGWGGEVRGTSGAFVVPASIQKELGGPGVGTNPEELFSAALANGLTSTLTALARSRSISLDSVETSVRTRLEWNDETQHHLARARISVRARSSDDAQTVQSLILKAREHCPVCNAIAVTVPLLLHVSVETTPRAEPAALRPEQEVVHAS